MQVVDEGQKFSLKMLRCEDRVFLVGTAYGYMISWPFFTPWKTRMRMNLDHVGNRRFVRGRDVHCEFDYWPLAVSMPPTKACLQSKAAVPVRWETCERCDRVFRSKRKAECTLREKAMKHMRAVESDSVKSARKAKDELHKACERASETRERNLHGQAHGKHERVTRQLVIDSSQHTSTTTCTAVPRVWHFSAFH